MKLNDFIQVVPALSVECCEDLITFIINNLINTSENDNQVQQFTELNYNQFASQEQMRRLCLRLREAINTYTDVYCPTGSRFFPQKYGIEEFRIKCYNDEGDCFRQHVDVGKLEFVSQIPVFLILSE